jgi:hypothetical protein
MLSLIHSESEGNTINFDRTLTTITSAALIGLFVLHFEGTAKLIQAIATGTTQYIGAIQGR